MANFLSVELWPQQKIPIKFFLTQRRVGTALGSLVVEEFSTPKNNFCRLKNKGGGVPYPNTLLHLKLLGSFRLKAAKLGGLSQAPF